MAGGDRARITVLGTIPEDRVEGLPIAVTLFSRRPLSS
jgi:hypothetical protein